MPHRIYRHKLFVRILLILGFIILVVVLSMTGYLYWRTTRFDSLIQDMAQRYQLDFALIKAVIHEESWYNPNSVGEDGEKGLMQLSRSAVREYLLYQKARESITVDLFHPAVNLQIGCWYLRQSIDLFKDFPDPVPLAVARYNAGESRVRQWIRIAGLEDSRNVLTAWQESIFLQSIQIPSTREYVHRVLTRYRSPNYSLF